MLSIELLALPVFIVVLSFFQLRSSLTIIGATNFGGIEITIQESKRS
jgi:hypothetical protein